MPRIGSEAPVPCGVTAPRTSTTCRGRSLPVRRCGHWLSRGTSASATVRLRGSTAGPNTSAVSRRASGSRPGSCRDSARRLRTSSGRLLDGPWHSPGLGLSFGGEPTTVGTLSSSGPCPVSERQRSDAAPYGAPGRTGWSRPVDGCCGPRPRPAVHEGTAVRVARRQPVVRWYAGSGLSGDTTPPGVGSVRLSFCNE